MKIQKYKFPFKMPTCQRELIQESKIMSELDTNILYLISYAVSLSFNNIH